VTVEHRGVDRGAVPVWSQPLGACVGSGGFASVWEIVDGGVLKVAHASHDLSRARLVREAEALQAIGPQAVPQLIAHGELGDGRAWIAMERIAGTNLGDLVATGSIPSNTVIGLSLRILDALEQIHAAGFAHRDLKPDNIVQRPDGSIVILDLGLARRIPTDPDDPNRVGVQVGSIEYMAPEQLVDATSAGVAADLYAFGCILYELAAGRPPFVGDSATLERAHAALRPLPLGALANVPTVVEELCNECLAKLPGRRPASAAAIASRLREVGAVMISQRVQHSRSVIAEGTQPVVLLWAELPRVDRALLSTLAARKITIISQRGRRVLGGVVGAEHADPAGAALAAARELAAAGARVALHLDALIVKQSADGVALTGASVERPEDWIPPAAWSGVVMTRALAAVMQIPTRPAEVGEGFVTFGEAGKTTELFGRGPVLAELVDDAGAALAGSGPALTLVIGDPGAGKTVLGAALVPRLVELGVRVHAGQVPPPGSHQPLHSVVSELIGTPVGPVVRAIGDAIRAAARERPTAIIIDDLHLAGHELLDALEYATLGGEPLPLWIIGLASPRLDQRRPGFGSRAERHRRHVLSPLDEDAAVAMTAALLRPAEYPPLRALRQIASIARGNPMHLVTLAREIHDRGAIRTRTSGEHFLDTSTLDALPPIALGPWLAVRELASLSVELVALARVCAVLGEELDRDELAAVIDLVERRGGATTTIDVDVGLRELESHGILRSGPGRWAFRQALVEEGIYATTNEAERRDLHVAALEYWQTMASDPAVAARVARHAEAVGERRVAAAAYAVVGRDAHERHRSLDADQAWHGAVRNLDDRDLVRGRALLGRARARYRLQRVRDALADLDDVLAIAIELGDPELEIEALLERSTALDWSDDYAASAAVAATARARQASVALPAVAAEVALAEARAVFRERFAAAVPFLETVVELARAAGHRETEIVAAVMLAPALVENRRLDEAEQVFDALIERCEASGDLLHLGAAYANRTFLWAARGQTERVAADLSTVIQLAREAGQATLEHIATYNLAEDRLWEGLFDEAAQLARRSLAIQRGHGEGALWPDHLLLSRIYAAKGDRVELRRSLAELAGVELGDADRVVVGVLECAATGAPREAWVEPLRETGRQLDPEMVNLRLELASLANDHDALPVDMRPELQALASKNPIWAKRHIF